METPIDNKLFDAIVPYITQVNFAERKVAISIPATLILDTNVILKYFNDVEISYGYSKGFVDWVTGTVAGQTHVSTDFFGSIKSSEVFDYLVASFHKLRRC